MKKALPKEVFLNNQWLPNDQAFVSIFDRGFMLGDGIYEVIPFYKGKPFLLQQHLDRLQFCLNEVQIAYTSTALHDIIQEAVKRSDLLNSDCIVYIQITRGLAPRTHHFPQKTSPTVLLYARKVTLQGFEYRKAKVLVAKDFRWHRCDIKSTSLIGNCMANNIAYSIEADENIFVRDGIFTEGSHTSVFFVRNEIVFTHPEGPHILSGITRKAIIDICIELHIPVKEEAIHLKELDQIDESFLTGTSTQIMSVQSMIIDNKERVISKEIGSITKRIQRAFIKKVAAM